jgi:hypothetical protein
LSGECRADEARAAGNKDRFALNVLVHGYLLSNLENFTGLLLPILLRRVVAHTSLE